ncbi:MAG: hypothetical protein ACXVPQ_08630 [Bacteroidia bacterium]
MLLRNYIFLTLVLCSVFFSCTQPKKQEPYMPLPCKISFDTFVFNPDAGMVRFFTKQNVSFPQGLDGLVSVFSSHYKSNVHFDFRIDSCIIEPGSVLVKLAAPSFVTDSAIEKPDILNDLKTGKDSIRTLFIDLDYPGVSFYEFYDNYYTRRPFIANKFVDGRPQKIGMDTLFLKRDETPKRMWDSIAAIIDPACKKYCND